MAGSPFQYLFFDTLTAVAVSELPMIGVSFSDVLNGIGQAQGVIPIQDPRIGAMSWNDATTPQRGFLIILYKGNPVWDGIVWQNNYDSSQGYSISASRSWSIWQHRLQAVGHAKTWATNPGGDPLVIAQTMIDEAQDVSIAGSQILGTSPSGIPVIIEGGPTPMSDWIVQAYPKSQLQTIDSIVTSLAALGYGSGFDYRMVTGIGGDGLTPEITLSYPRSGVVGENEAVIFDVQRAPNWTYPLDGSSAASSLTVAATRSGGVQQLVYEPRVVNEGYPLIEGTFSISGLTHQTAVDAIAKGHLNISAYPIAVPTVTTYTDADPVLGSFSVGDDALMLVPSVAEGLPFSPRFPNGLRELFRVQQWQVTVPDTGGRAKCVTSLVQPPSDSPIPPPQ